MDTQDQVRVWAKGLASRWYARQHPRASRDEAWGYAERHWRAWAGKALDVLAVLRADREAREAGPLN